MINVSYRFNYSHYFPTTRRPSSKFIRTIKGQINDFSYVEIVTAAGDPKIDVNPDAEKVLLGFKAEELKILARTRIELDGDILMILPTATNNEIIVIHKENVDTLQKHNPVSSKTKRKS